MKVFRMLLLMVAVMVMTVQGHAAEKNRSKEVVWNKVVCEGIIHELLKVTKVVMSSKKTDVTLHTKLQKGASIEIPPSTVLEVGNKTYKLKAATPCEPGKKYTMPEDTLSFTLTFEPLPKGTKEFGMKIFDGFSFHNIHEKGYVPDYITNTYWRSDVTGDWLIGFVADYVIYNNDVHSIKSQKEKKGAYTITTDDGTVINVGRLKNDVRSIKIDNGKEVQCSMITGTSLPDYPVKDLRKGFKDNGYSLTDSVTIRGWIKGVPQKLRKSIKRHTFNVRYADVISGHDVEVDAELDSLGRFSMTVPLLNSTPVYLGYFGRLYCYTIFEPGEEYYILSDLSTDLNLIMGSDVRMQNELLTHEPLWKARADVDYNEENLDAMKYLAQTDSVRSIQKEHLHSLIMAHPNLSQRYVDFIEGLYLVTQGKDLMQARFYVPNWVLPQEYVDYVGNEIWKKMPTPYTLHGSSFLTFLRDYIENLEDTRSKNNQDTYIKVIADSVCTDKALHDIVLAYKFFYELDWKRKPLQSDFLKLANEEIATEAIRTSVLNYNEKYVEIGKRDISDSPCLKSSDIVKDMTDGEEIFRKIMEPYKGRIVLIDVWGTWCSPCKNALQDSQEEYKRLKPYDMVFMYLANRSEDDSWKNVIKEYEILGDNVVHYNLPFEQQKALQEYIKVSSYPTYKLVDKSGNLVDERVDARHLDDLEKVLKKLQ